MAAPSNGRPQGRAFELGANKFQILYTETTGGSNFGGGKFGAGSGHVTITVVPEPQSLVAIGLYGLIGIVTSRFRQTNCW